MSHISHEEQHRKFPVGTVVFALNGERLGTVRTVYDHFFLVKQDASEHADLEVPPHAVVRFEGGRIDLSVNRTALTVVDDAESSLRRSQHENG